MSTHDHQLIQQLAYRYAKACDRRDPGLLASCLHENAEIIVPGLPAIEQPGIAERTIETLASMFSATQHRVYNCSFEIVGENATGEVYGSAAHLLSDRAAGQAMIDEWAIRYQDTLCKLAGRWLFVRRELCIDWREERVVILP